MTKKFSQTEVHQFIRQFVESRNGIIIEKSDDTFEMKLPNQTASSEYTYEPTIAREKNSTLIAPGSAAFQLILNECTDNGILSQIQVKPKANYEALLKEHFKENPFDCPECTKISIRDEVICVCTKAHRCSHHINNGRIASIKIVKNEPIRYFQFYYSTILQNKLRSRSEEILSILLDEKGTVVENEDQELLEDPELLIQDFRAKTKLPDFEELKVVAEQKLEAALKSKLPLFELPLIKEKESKLRMFEKRIRRERLERLISKKADFNPQRWQANYEALLRREEESLTTIVSAKLINLLVINTSRISFEIKLDNKAIVHTLLIPGIKHTPEVSCSICHKIFNEGYATEDKLYVCNNCIKQSIDTEKIYSKKAALRLDETLNEYIEQDSGFICEVCGKKHSKLLEFKCSHDDSRICIYHYGLCDICDKVFSNLNLSSTGEFRRKLCPTHSLEQL